MRTPPRFPWWFRNRPARSRTSHRKHRDQLHLELHPKPPRRGKQWDAIRVATRTERCEIHKCQLLLSSHQGHIDHIVPEQFVFERRIGDPHARENLICICREDHGRKTAIEWRLYRGDLVGFLDELRVLGWDLDRVKVALRLYGLLDSAREMRCQS